MSDNHSQLPSDVAKLQAMVQELQQRCHVLSEKVAAEEHQTAELARLYHQVTGEPPNPKWNTRDYALEIYYYLDNIISLVPGQVFWLDKNHAYLGCNLAQAKLAGFNSVQEMIGKTASDLPWKLQADILEAANNEVMNTGNPLIIEEAVDTNEGKKVYLSEKVPLRNKKGEITGLLGVALDITEQKEAIKILEYLNQKNEEQTNDKLKLGDVYKLEQRNQELKIALDRCLMENRQYQTITQRELSEFSAFYQQVTGQAPEPRLNLRDYALAIYKYFDNIISLAPGHIFWLDTNNVYLGCNEEHAKNLGLISREFIVGKTNAQLFWKEQAASLDEVNRNVMKTGKSIVAEEVVNTVQGLRTYLSAKVPMRNLKGQVIGILGTAFDITEQKQAMETLGIAKKKAEEASWAKSEFIQNMSHDLKTPLMTIMGMAELLSYSEPEEKRKERLLTIHKAGKRILEIFNGILDAASVEAGAVNIKRELTNIRDIFQSLQELYSPLAQEKNLTLNIQVNDDVPAEIISDPMRIQRILLNLMGNALKFTKQGEVTAKARIEKEDDKNLLILSVTDTGIGMPADKLELIFEKFIRLTSAYEGKYSGTGLGLGIVKRFAEELGGHVIVESKEGEGTTFICKIPIN